MGSVYAPRLTQYLKQSWGETVSTNMSFKVSLTSRRLWKRKACLKTYQSSEVQYSRKVSTFIAANKDSEEALYREVLNFLSLLWWSRTPKAVCKPSANAERSACPGSGFRSTTGRMYSRERPRRERKNGDCFRPRDLLYCCTPLKLSRCKFLVPRSFTYQERD